MNQFLVLVLISFFEFGLEKSRILSLRVCANPGLLFQLASYHCFYSSLDISSSTRRHNCMLVSVKS